MLPQLRLDCCALTGRHNETSGSRETQHLNQKTVNLPRRNLFAIVVFGNFVWESKQYQQPIIVDIRYLVPLVYLAYWGLMRVNRQTIELTVEKEGANAQCCNSHTAG